MWWWGGGGGGGGGNKKRGLSLQSAGIDVRLMSLSPGSQARSRLSNWLGSRCYGARSHDARYALVYCARK